MKTIVSPNYATGTYQGYKCMNWDTSGEQFLIGEYETQEQAHDACIADQANNVNNGYRIEYYNGVSTGCVEEIYGINPEA